jgi:hypothetical protein
MSYDLLFFTIRLSFAAPKFESEFELDAQVGDEKIVIPLNHHDVVRH